MKITQDAARSFALKKQCFQFPQTSVKKEHVFSVLKALSCVQIDTINVVERSHYLVFWSRLGNYKKELLDQLLYPDRKVFEYWAHAASLIPIEHYRYFIPTMKKRQKEIHSKAKRWLKGKESLLDTVLHEIKHDGPLCSKDFENEHKDEKKEKSGWWSWKPAKMALEMLYDAGILMVSRRDNFQKYYDLTENVLPSSVDMAEPTEEERQQFFVEKTLDAWGLVELKDVGQYFYKWSTHADVGVKAISGLMKEWEKQDIVATVHIADVDKPYFTLTKDLADLEKTVTSEEQISNIGLISPFDNLTWSKPRIKKLFDFHPALETYLPKKDRKFGYYALTILYNDQIVGRLDPKMHRDKATLEIKALELREGFKPTAGFKQQLSSTLRDFMKFHNAQALKAAKDCSKFVQRLL